MKGINLVLQYWLMQCLLPLATATVPSCGGEECDVGELRGDKRDCSPPAPSWFASQRWASADPIASQRCLPPVSRPSYGALLPPPIFSADWGTRGEGRRQGLGEEGRRLVGGKGEAAGWG
jgi:hypothetical protein